MTKSGRSGRSGGSQSEVEHYRIRNYPVVPDSAPSTLRTILPQSVGLICGKAKVLLFQAILLGCIRTRVRTDVGIKKVNNEEERKKERKKEEMLLSRFDELTAGILLHHA